MLQSMTGFGKAQAENNGSIINVGIRTLNSKQFDISLKIPNRYKEREYDIRQMACNILKRGKIDLTIQMEGEFVNSGAIIDENKAIQYHEMLENLCGKNGIKAPSDWLSILLRLPDVVSQNSPEISDGEWNLLLETVNKAIVDCCNFRGNEGNALEKELLLHVGVIEEKLHLIIAFEKERIGIVREKISKELEKLPQSVNYNSLRFEEEMIYYLEKIDITEEKTRLQQHINFFRQSTAAADENGMGKKLAFIAQEMGREINTLGNKASHFDIQKLVVEMKDELEKIKEQVLNVL